jgi:glycosyltransferase involved in cell wall biosynthesis
LRERMERLVRERQLDDVVRLPGAVGQDDIRRYYEEADVFVLPSFAEGLPVVLMEAMAVGLPVVTSRIAAIPELVDDGVNGFVLPPGRVDALVEALRCLASDSALRRRMGEQGRQKVIAEYHIEASVLTLRDMFAEVSRGRRHAAVTGDTEP